MHPRLKSKLLVFLQFLLIGLLCVNAELKRLQVMAVIIILLALLLAGWAIVAMRKSKWKIMPEPADDAILTTNGPYRFVRHPMYTAVLLGSAGLVINHFTWMRFAIFLALVAVLIIKLFREERMLLNKFTTYQNYQTYTSRLIPFLFSTCLIITVQA